MKTRRISTQINELNRIALGSLELKQPKKIIERFVNIGIKILDADFGYAFFKPSQNKNLTLLYVSPKSPYKPIGTPRKFGIVSRTIKSKKPMLIEDTTRLKYMRHDVTNSMRSVIIIPLQSKNRVFGTLHFSFLKKQTFDPDTANLANLIGIYATECLLINSLYGNLRSYKKILDSTEEPIIIIGETNKHVVYANKAAQEFTQETRTVTPEEKLLAIKKLLSHNKLAEAIMTEDESPVTKVSFQIPHNELHATRIAEFELQRMKLNPWGKVTLLIIRDVTALKKNEARMIKNAYTDQLTGLSNRAKLDEDIQHILKNNSEFTPFNLLILDLDRFKFINDSLGHHAGDLVLKETAMRLKACLRDPSHVYRIGGDEFVVLLNQDSNQTVGEVSTAILRAFDASLTILDQEIYISVSIGTSTYPEDGTDYDTLIKNADYGLYMAKEEGGGTVKHLTSKKIFNTEHWKLESELRQAIKQNQFTFYYQPIHSITDKSVMHSYEAILRWKHPVHGLVTPKEFYQHIEASGIITLLTEWQFTEACLLLKQLKRIKKEVPISINISAKQLFQANFFTLVTSVLKKHRIPPQLIHLELTETLLIKNIEYSKTILNNFRQEGFSVVMDDFGTGYASLSYLRNIRVDCIKIDQSFVQNMEQNPVDLAVVKAIVVLCKELNLGIIAEGVETESQRTLLTLAGIPHIQGYLYSQPMDPEKLLHYLKTF